MQAAARFLEALVAAVPYGIHTVLTDNGIRNRHQKRCIDGACSIQSVPLPSVVL
jgi:hypothetical protein